MEDFSNGVERGNMTLITFTTSSYSFARLFARLFFSVIAKTFVATFTPLNELEDTQEYVHNGEKFSFF